MRQIFILCIFLATTATAQVNIAVKGDPRIEMVSFDDDSILDMKHGFRDGEWRIYYDSAHLRMARHCFLSTDFAHRFDTTWYSNGQIADAWCTRAQYCNTCVETETWLSSGAPEFKLTCNADSCIVTRYYPSGKISEMDVAYIVDSVRQPDHYMVEYFENGQLMHDPIGPYSDTLRTIHEYYDSGKLRAEYSIVQGNYQGSYTEWHENGTISVKGQYTETKLPAEDVLSVRTGKWFYYDENGKLIKKEIYRNDELVRSKEY